MRQRGEAALFVIIGLLLVSMLIVGSVVVFLVFFDDTVYYEIVESDIMLDIVDEQIVVDETAGTLTFDVLRQAGAGEMQGITFVVKDRQGNVYYETQTVSMQEGEQRVFTLTLEGVDVDDLERFSAVPVVKYRGNVQELPENAAHYEFELEIIEVVETESVVNEVSNFRPVTNTGGSSPGGGSPSSNNNNNDPPAEPEPEPEINDSEEDIENEQIWIDHNWTFSGTTAQKQNISRSGISFYFDKPYTTGQFANGDYWVLIDESTGIVNITRVTPDFTQYNFNGTQRYINGLEINPSLSGQNPRQGLDQRTSDFDLSLVPTLPYASRGNESVLKVDSWEETGVGCIQGPVSNNGPCLYSAVVLTVVDTIPPHNGSSVFRPPYFGTNKTYYSLTDIDPNALLSLVPPSNAPSLTWVKNRFTPVQLDHIGWPHGQMVRPHLNLPEYPSYISEDTGDAALRLMINDPFEDKIPALVPYLQYGIDIHHMVKGGVRWPSKGGYGVGRKAPYVFTAVTLNNSEMKYSIASKATHQNHYFAEDGQVYYGEGGYALFGSAYGYPTTCSEGMYWLAFTAANVFGDISGDRACADPYGQIDGGDNIGFSYQGCCTSSTWKAGALLMNLHSEFNSTWNNTALLDYVTRWIDQGAVSQPDTCAPPDPREDPDCKPISVGQPNCIYYGVTYGPDPANPGECIQDTDPSDGIGRKPDRHGVNANGTVNQYFSQFAQSMWDAYSDYTVDFETCGNEMIDGIETCDGNLLQGESCISQGYDYGTLACSNQCSGYDFSSCGNYICGNNIIEPDETCDDGNAQGADGCSSSCQIESGFVCSGEPSVCSVDSTLDVGLVGYWDFEGDALDKSGNERNGVVNGATFVSGVNGVGQSLYFDGNDYVTVADHASLDLVATNFTISVWVNATVVTTTTAAFVDKKWSDGYFLGRSRTGSGSTILFSTGLSNDPKASSIDQHQWMHLVATYNTHTGLKRVYKNNVTIIHETQGNSVQGNDDPLRFGGPAVAGYANYLTGRLDDIRIYNRILSREEISQLYTEF